MSKLINITKSFDSDLIKHRDNNYISLVSTSSRISPQQIFDISDNRYVIKVDNVNEIINGQKTFTKHLISNEDVVAYSNENYTGGTIFDNLPDATYSSKGVIRVDNTQSLLTINNGVLSFNPSYSGFGINETTFNSLGDARYSQLSHQHSLSQITSPTSNITWSMGGNTLRYNFTNPVGGILISMAGGWSGHVFDIIDSASTQGSSSDHMIHIETSRQNVLPAHFVNNHASGMAIHAKGVVDIEGNLIVSGNITNNTILYKSNNLSDLNNISTARTNLGLTGDSNTTHYHDGRYYLKSETDGKYLQLSGGTLTGDLILSDNSNKIIGFNSSSSPKNLTIRGNTHSSTGVGGDVTISAGGAGGTGGNLILNSGSAPTNGYVSILHGTTERIRTTSSSVDITGVVNTNSTMKIGGTMTANKILNIRTGTSTTVSGYRVWRPSDTVGEIRNYYRFTATDASADTFSSYIGGARTSTGYDLVFGVSSSSTAPTNKMRLRGTNNNLEVVGDVVAFSSDV